MHQARERLGNRQLVFGFNEGQASHSSWDDFRRLAELAADYGGTHLVIGNFPYRHGSWILPDNEDPYAAWCNTTTAILRVCPPPELQPWVAGDHAKWCQEHLHKQLEIMRPLGLKGICHAVEPLWLPEEVYRAHPHWRGAQCELARIALRPYFAPSIDEPEVLDLYRRGMKEFSTLFPEVDSFQFLSNDSGGGIAWTPCIYPGMNGPVKYRTRDGGERLANWMKTLQQGAREAGAEVRFNIYSSGFPPELRASVREKLPSGLFISGANSVGEQMGGASASFGGGLWSFPYPAIGLASPADFLKGLQQVYNNPANDSTRASIGIHSCTLDTARELLDCYFRHPEAGLREHTEAILDAAATFCGNPAHAETIISAWTQIQTAIHATQQIRQKGFGHIFNFCTVSMRWLLRPLVPEPHKLTREESRHYRDFVFSPGDQKDDADFGMVLGKSVFNGESVTWMSRWCLHEAISTLQGVQSRLDRLAKELDAEAAARVSLLAARVGTLACLAANARNCIMYKYALDTASQPLYGPNQTDYDDNIVYDQRALTFRKIAREELDNTAELIRLIESQPLPVIEHAANADEESVFLLGPDVVGALRHKLDIMLDHWQDYERLYPATKVHDFEPQPRGNLPIFDSNAGA